MADAFSQFDARLLLFGKYVLFIGDSNTRANYKDLLWLLSSNTLMSNTALRTRTELGGLGEKLLKRSELNQARDFKEHRLINFEDNKTTLEFVFITRCYNHQVEDVFKRIGNKSKLCPDIVVMNSCVWDLTRWGPNGVPQYKDNMVRLLRLMKKSLPPECLVIWTTTLPPAAHVRGGLIIKQVQCMEPLLRFEVMEANTFARDVVTNHGFDVLDHHYHTRMQMHRRAKDGIHYMPIAVRLMTNLLLTHVALSWGSELPNNVNTMLLDKAIAQASSPVETCAAIPTTGIFAKINLKSPVVPRKRGIQITLNSKEGKTSRDCKYLGDVAENDPGQIDKPLSPPFPHPMMRSVVVEPQQHSRRALEFQYESGYVDFQGQLEYAQLQNQPEYEDFQGQLEYAQFQNQPEYVDFQNEPEYGPYRRRNRNRKTKKKNRNTPYYYDQRFIN